MAKKFAIILGILLALFGLLGFMSNPIIGPEKFFHANLAHNLVHLLLGVILLAAGLKNESAAGLALKVTAAVYLLLSLLGFVMGTDKLLLGLLAINAADSWLHLLLAIILFSAGMSAKPTETMMPPPVQMPPTPPMQP